MDLQQQTNKRMRKMLIFLAILFGCIFIYKGFQNLLLKWSLSANKFPIIEVSAIKAGYSKWQPELTATGSLRAIKGVNVTTEVAGMVQEIYFTPGVFVKKNTVLAQLNADSDNALLHSLEANAELAKITYFRDKAQYAVKAVSKQTLDTDAANLKSLRAQVAQQEALVLKKTIHAPFDGHLGISKINPGQYLNPGDMIVTLQTLDPIYVDFYVPQQSLAKLEMGQVVKMTSDAFPGLHFNGTITTINPIVDNSTRNVQVEATIANPHYLLKPGMFTKVTVITGPAYPQLTLPQTAISFNPYGELVFVIKQVGKSRKGNPILQAHQVFVVTGETRGNQIAILKGVKEGDPVVTSGQLKLKNDSQIIINNTIVPLNNAIPDTPDEH